MASAVIQKSAEFPSPSVIDKIDNKSKLDFRGTSDKASSGLKDGAATFRPIEEENPRPTKMFGVNPQPRSPSPLRSSQISMNDMSLDNVFNKDPNFDLDEYKQRNHTPTKRVLDIPGEKRNKTQDTRLYKDLLANQGRALGISLSPEKVKESIEDVQFKQDLMTLRGEINLLKQKVNQIEKETQRDSVASTGSYNQSPNKNVIRNTSSLSESPQVSTNRGHYPSIAGSLRQSRVQQPINKPRASQDDDNPLTITAQKSQKFQTPQPHKSQQEINKGEIQGSPSKESPPKNLENSLAGYYNPQMLSFKEPGKSSSHSYNTNPTKSPKSSTSIYQQSDPQQSNNRVSPTGRQSAYSDPQSSSPERHSHKVNYSTLTNFPPYYKKEALYRPKYGKIIEQNRTAKLSKASPWSETPGPKIAESTRNITSGTKLSHPTVVDKEIRPFNPSSPSYTNNPGQQRLRDVSPFTPNVMHIPRQSSTAERSQNTIPAKEASANQFDVSNQLSNIMSFYESQMDTLRNTILRQNSSILQQSGQIGDYELSLGRQKNKITALEERLRDQIKANDKQFSHLRNQYDQSMNEIGRYKANIEILASRIAEQSMKSNQLSEKILSQEVQSLKNDLKTHRSFIFELEYAKSNLERQIRDLERNLQRDAESARQEQLHNALEKHRYQYDTISQMNQAIIESCERTKRDLEMIRSHTHQKLNLHSSPRTSIRFAETLRPALSFQQNDERIPRLNSALKIFDISKGNSQERANRYYKSEKINSNAGFGHSAEQLDLSNSEFQRNRSRDRRNLVSNLISGRTQSTYEDGSLERKKGPTKRHQYPESAVDELLSKKKHIENEILSLPESSKTSFHRRAKTHLERALEDIELQIEDARSETRRSHYY